MNTIKEIIGYIMLKVFGLSKSLKIYYKIKTGYKLNLDKPIKYSEKIQYRKLNYNNPLYTLCADKYEVRKYVENKIGKEYLIPLYFAKKKITVEDIKKLPSSFVLKTNNASKTNIIVQNKSSVDISKIVKKMNKYVKYKFGYRTFELFYNNIKPLIIAEKFMGDKKGNVPNDYKFFCFNNGKNKAKIIIQIDQGRYTSKHARAYFNENWELQPYNDMVAENINFKKPEQLSEMISIAKKLSEDFNFVRVDLYEIKNKIYFGELTFTDGSGYDILKPDKYDAEWGSNWNEKKEKY